MPLFSVLEQPDPEQVTDATVASHGCRLTGGYEAGAPIVDTHVRRDPLKSRIPSRGSARARLVPLPRVRRLGLCAQRVKAEGSRGDGELPVVGQHSGERVLGPTPQEGRREMDGVEGAERSWEGI